MVRKTLIPALAALLAVACGKSLEHNVSELYRAVPSRSVAVARFQDCGKGLPLLLDSTSVLRSLDYGRLAGSEAVLSFDYNSAIVPLLCIRCGKAVRDTSEAVSGLLSNAKLKGVKACYIPSFLDRHSLVLLSPSKAVIDEAKSHIERGASIMDAPGFSDAAALDRDSRAALILRNESARRWLPASLPDGLPARRDLAPFVSDLAVWTVLNFGSYAWGEVEASFSDGDSRNCFSKVLGTLNPGKSALQGGLPESPDFISDLLIPSSKDYLAAYEAFLDANAGLSKYKGVLAGLRSGSGKDPGSWLAGLDPRELALVRWDGHEVLLLRPASRRKDSGIEENACPGFIPALFGGAFRLADDSCVAFSRPWMVQGSADDVQAWLDADKSGAVLEKNTYSYLVYSRGASLRGDKENVVLNVH